MQHGMKGDTGDGRHNIGWKGRYRWMEEDTTCDGRRYSDGWKKTQNRMKGDTVVDGRRHNIGW